MYESSKSVFLWSTYPQTFDNGRKVLCGGVWKEVVVRAPLWRSLRKEEVVEECDSSNSYWKADDEGNMVRLREAKGIYR